MSSVVGIELIGNSSNVVRFILLRPDAMLIPRFYKRGDLIARQRRTKKRHGPPERRSRRSRLIAILEVFLKQEELIR